MLVNFFITCIGDTVKVKMAKKSVLLMEKLGCTVIVLENQTCCGQPSINSGYVNESISSIKNMIKTFEQNSYPIISPAGSCAYMLKKYPDFFDNEDPWKKRAQKVSDRVEELTSFIVNTLKITDVGAKLKGTAVYHPSCSLFRKLNIVNEPIKLLESVNGLTLLKISNQETCCGFGGTFSVKMAEISGEMVKEKVSHISEVNPDYLIGADESCLLNIGGRIHREGKEIKVMHIVDVLISDQELIDSEY